MVLRHAQHGIARVAIRRNGGAPLGVAHTDQLDFMLMNGGGGTAQTDASIGRVLTGLADTLRTQGSSGSGRRARRRPAAAQRDGRRRKRRADGNGAATAPRRTRRIAPRIDLGERTISFELDETGVSRLALYDAVLRFADRCYVFLTRPRRHRHRRPAQAARRRLRRTCCRVLVRDVTSALNQVARNAVAGHAPHSDHARGARRRCRGGGSTWTRCSPSSTPRIPPPLGLGFQAERGPGHENLRVLNIRGTGACNSECVFCIEKFNPTHRPMPKADATRQLILDSAGQVRHALLRQRRADDPPEAVRVRRAGEERRLHLLRHVVALPHLLRSALRPEDPAGGLRVLRHRAARRRSRRRSSR